MAWAGRVLDHVCFNLTFQSEEELAAIAAGMSPDSEPEGTVESAR